VIEELLQRHPDITAWEIKQQLNLQCHISTISKSIQEAGWRYIADSGHTDLCRDNSVSTGIHGNMKLTSNATLLQTIVLLAPLACTKHLQSL
jgi:hypothetical protein